MQVTSYQNNQLTKHFLNTLAKGSSGEIHNELCRYKENGHPKHLEVLKIPKEDRLPMLVTKYGQDKILVLLAKIITKTLSNLNLRVGMNADQVIELALALIDSANEDQLAIQDIMLFLDGLQKAKYGKIYDRMDMPTFFEMLEVYRQDRHEALVNHNEEYEAQIKCVPVNDRISDLCNDRDKHKSAAIEYLKTKL
jgi:hypothetical protein